MSKFCASLRLAAPEPSTVGGLHHIPSRPGRLAAPHTHDRRLRAVPSQAAHRRCCPRCPARPATERRAFTGRSPAMRPTLFPTMPTGAQPVPAARRARQLPARRPWHSPGAPPWHGLPTTSPASTLPLRPHRAIATRLRDENVTLLAAVRGLLPSGAQPPRYGIYDYKNAPCPKGSTPAVRPNQAR